MNIFQWAGRFIPEDTTEKIASQILFAREMIRNGLSPVREFHVAFKHPVEGKPIVPSFNTRALRVRLLLEEVLEFAEASGVDVIAENTSHAMKINRCSIKIESSSYFVPNLGEAADALGDIRYVTDGANLCWGFPQDEILLEIHRSNMSKLGPNGKPVYRSDNKVMKGPNYSPPNILKILQTAMVENEE